MRMNFLYVHSLLLVQELKNHAVATNCAFRIFDGPVNRFAFYMRPSVGSGLTQMFQHSCQRVFLSDIQMACGRAKLCRSASGIGSQTVR